MRRQTSSRPFPYSLNCVPSSSEFYVHVMVTLTQYFCHKCDKIFRSLPVILCRLLINSPLHGNPDDPNNYSNSLSCHLQAV